MTRPDPLDELGLSLRRGAAELYVVRHADAVPEAHETFTIYDDYEAHPLSARPRAQAEAVAERFADAGLTAVYASRIRRARETAEAIAAVARVEVREAHDLREIEIGPVGGEMTLAARLAWLATIALRDGSWNGIPGTEPSEHVRARMLRTVDAIAARHPGERVAVVSHAGAMNALLAAVLGSAHEFLFPLANASVSVLRTHGDRRLLMSANETAHLAAIPSRART